MRFIETKLKGAYLIEIEKLEDDRGFFGRAWCCDEFEKMGLNADIKQINTSFSPQKGTLRGLHYQIESHLEAKFIRCTQGRIFDVIVDLRPDSPTFLQWDGYELGAENGRMLYVPEHFATGFITLEDDCGMYYPTTQVYVPGVERGIRYDDPAIGIDWPVEATAVSEKDRHHPDLNINNFTN